MIDSILLTNIATNKSVLIDKDRSEFVLDEADLGTIQGTHHSYRYINQIGSYIDSTSMEERPVAISGWVIGTTYDNLRINKSALNRLVNPQQTIRVTVFDSYALDFKPDYSIQYSKSYRENNEVLCRFLIQGTCSNPLFTAINRSSVLIASVTPKFMFPLVIPQGTGILMGLREPSLLATVYNPGDLGTGMLVTISCTSSVKNPSLMNVNTREFIRLEKELSVGEIITISTESGNKYIKGTVDAVESNYFKYFDLDSTWLQLYAGENILKYDADENPDGMKVQVSFLPRYLEVE